MPDFYHRRKIGVKIVSCAPTFGLIKARPFIWLFVCDEKSNHVRQLQSDKISKCHNPTMGPRLPMSQQKKSNLSIFLLKINVLGVIFYSTCTCAWPTVIHICMMRHVERYDTWSNIVRLCMSYVWSYNVGPCVISFTLVFDQLKLEPNNIHLYSQHRVMYTDAPVSGRALES